MDDLFGIVVILLILLAPVLEALFKKRKRGGADGSGAPPGRGGGVGERGEGGRRSSPGEATAADELVPDDLWELITGERRAPQPREEPWRAPRGTEEPASRVEIGGAETPAGDDTGAGAEAAWTPEPPGGGEPEAPEAISTFEDEAEEERIRRLALREEGRRGARGRASLLAGARAGPLARRGRAPASARPTHPLLGEVDRRALRKAVLWREILGPPVSLREDA